MTTAQFFEKFDLIADAPDAVAKMRSLILELAVRGQLTSASPQPSASSDPSANPFPIPQDWRWIPLREVAAPCGQKKPDARFTYIDVGAIDNQRGVISAKAEVVEATKAPSRARKIVRSGCVIYATVRPYLRNIAIVTREFDPPAIASTAFAVLMPEKVLDAQFLFYWLRCASFQDIVSSKMKGVAYPAISDTEFWQCPIPLPPLAEQKRIVAKVDELMALCNQLEAQQRERETKHTALAQATLARFAEAPTPTDLNLLFHSSFSIQPSDLRKTILTLAVQGKLVPQDARDQPAEELLQSIIRARAALAHQGSVKTKVTIPPITPDKEPYSIPETWCWVPLNEITELVYGRLLPTTELLPEGFPVFGANGIIGRFSKYKYEDEMLLISCRGAYSGTPNISPPKCYVTNNSIVCEFFEPKACDIRFFQAVISISPREQIVTGSAQPQVTVANAIKLPVPLPPLAEQKRIVAKVQELMTLVDELEAQQAAADQAATHLLDAVVSELAAAA